MNYADARCGLSAAMPPCNSHPSRSFKPTLAAAIVATAWFLWGPNAQAQIDFGDAPNSYLTLSASGGAAHGILTTIRLGATIDGEPDGQPNATATGDDTTGVDDEDGVVFLTAIIPGQVARVQVTASVSGFLNAWLDFNRNGVWNAGEQVFTNLGISTGPNTLSFNVPAAASLGSSFARFRFVVDGSVGPGGFAQNGEVEDYQVSIEQEQLDFGDAPTNFYPTVLSLDGARHPINPQYCLGTQVDVEPDGQPAFDAQGDDLTGTDDEDGVTLSALVAGQGASANVFLTAGTGISARLDAWVDFNADGDWGDANERIATAFPLAPGINTLAFSVPPGAVPGQTYARFRLSEQGGLDFKGPGLVGEVEDYQVNITALLDFSDAPAPYPTLLANNGARHAYNQSFFLGTLIDLESNGQPNTQATGDDLNGPGGDDEDGVIFRSQLIGGQTASVDVTASLTGFLNAWIDWNQNGSWADPGDQIFTGLPIGTGVNPLTFSVPAGAGLGLTYARFRFSSTQFLGPAGLASNGEVEDYQVRISREQDRCDLGCKGREYWLTFPGNYAPDPDNPVRPELCIRGPAGTAVTAEVPGLGFATNVVIAAIGDARIALPKEVDLGDLNDAATNLAIHVTATADISVFAFNKVRWTTDSYLALPAVVFGKEYVVLAAPNLQTNAPPLNGTQFAIVACESNTTVTITPSVTTGTNVAGVPYVRLLQAGECYQLRNTRHAPADLTGTIITSDKPVGVFGSHRCANMPSLGLWFCDYLVEHLLPVNTWGTLFYTAPLATRTGGDTVRCVAAQDNTMLTVNGAPAGTINRGEVQQFLLTTGSRITASKPILVGQYANSSDFDLVTDADPFMSLVQATRHYTSNYTICVPATNFTANFVNVIAPSASIAGITLDGAAIPGPFTAIGASGFSYARVPVTPGPHTLAGNVLFGATVYGWAEYESYGHPACFFFGDIQPPTLTALETNVIVTADANCQGRVPSLVQLVTVEDNCSQGTGVPVTQNPTPDTSLPPGVHIVTLFAQDTSGNVGSTGITLTVLDPFPAVMNCPSNIVVDCTSSNGAVVTYLVTASSACNTNIPVVCTPPPGSLFPVGTTLVTCRAQDGRVPPTECTFPVTVRCAGSLDIELLSNRTIVHITWTGSTGTLERAASPVGAWTPITNGVNEFFGPVQPQNSYFRVRY